jgi:hypothetical protein
MNSQISGTNKRVSHSVRENGEMDLGHGAAEKPRSFKPGKSQFESPLSIASELS